MRISKYCLKVKFIYRLLGSIKGHVIGNDIPGWLLPKLPCVLDQLPAGEHFVDDPVHQLDAVLDTLISKLSRIYADPCLIKDLVCA